MIDHEPEPAGSSENEEGRRGTARTVVVRVLRAASRVFLSPAHLDQLFGPGARLNPIWPGMIGETLCLERVAVGAGRREVRVRVCLSNGQQTCISLTASALNQLELRGAPPFGGDGNVGAAVSGPKGAVVLSSGVCRAAVRLVMPEGVARKLGLSAEVPVELSIPSFGEVLDSELRIEVRPGIKESVLVVDGGLADRLGEPGGQVPVKLAEKP